VIQTAREQELMMKFAKESCSARRHLCGVCVLVWALAAAGCGENPQGIAKVAPETRQQLAPHVAEKQASDGAQPVAGKSFSIKYRGKPAASP
jgi:hypothetical protein